jgi:hypothetical protein
VQGCLALCAVGCYSAASAACSYAWSAITSSCFPQRRMHAARLRAMRNNRAGNIGSPLAGDDVFDEDDEELMSIDENTRLVRQPSISFKEQLTMSPIEKLWKYHRIPFKLLLNITVTVLITVFMISDNLQYASYVNASSENFRRMLNNAQADTLEGETRLYSVIEFQSSLNLSVSNYFNAPTTYLYAVNVSDSVAMTVLLRDGTKNTYQLTQDDPLGPFTSITPDMRAAVLNNIIHVTLEYILETTEPTYAGSGQYSTLEFTWFCDALYDFRIGGGCIEYSVDISASISGSAISVLARLDIALIVMCLWSILLTIRALYRSWLVYRFARYHLSQPIRRPTTTTSVSSQATSNNANHNNNNGGMNNNSSNTNNLGANANVASAGVHSGANVQQPSGPTVTSPSGNNTTDNNGNNNNNNNNVNNTINNNNTSDSFSHLDAFSWADVAFVDKMAFFNLWYVFLFSRKRTEQEGSGRRRRRRRR